MCKVSYRNSGLDINTWCGELVDDKPKHICRIGDDLKAKHYVKVSNRKTLNTKVNIKGIMERKRAKFEGDASVITSELEWTHSMTLLGKYGLNEETFGDAVISKKARGSEIVKVEIEYEDHWNHNVKKHIDPNNLIFKIDVD